MKRTGKPWGGKRVSVSYDDAVSRLSWEQFEHLVAAWYAAQGYTVDHRGTAARGHTDGGVDLVVRRNGRRLLVQCKHAKAYQVPYNPVMQLAALIKGDSDDPADGAVFVTSGEFTPEAIRKASRFPELSLIDGAALRRMLGAVPAEPAPALIAPAAPAPIALPGELAPMAPSGGVPALGPHTPGPVGPQRVTVGQRARLPVATRKTSPGLPRLAAVGCLLMGVAALGFLGVRWRDQGTDGSGAAGMSSASTTPGPSAVPAAPGQGGPASDDAAGPRHDAGGRRRNHDAIAARHRPVAPRATQAPSAQRPTSDGASTAIASRMADGKTADTATDAATDPATRDPVIYRSGNMSDAEFAAWKQRRSRREGGTDDGEASPADPANAVHASRGEVSPEAMKVILRTNRP
jgi:hypothetical protein